MSFLGSFFGSDQRRDIRRAKTASDALLTEGLDAARSGYTSATDRLDPYATSGNAANAMYARAIGLEGRPAQEDVVANFMADPFRAENERLANENLVRQFGARGMANSGAFASAAARGNLERGSVDWNQWLDRISGVSTQGANIAGQQAGLDVGRGDLEWNAANTRAGNEINYGNAMASSRNIGINNILGAAGTVVRGFTPGWGGQTPFGNAMNAMRA